MPLVQLQRGWCVAGRFSRFPRAERGSDPEVAVRLFFENALENAAGVRRLPLTKLRKGDVIRRVVAQRRRGEGRAAQEGYRGGIFSCLVPRDADDERLIAGERAGGAIAFRGDEPEVGGVRRERGVQRRNELSHVLRG